MSRQKEIFIYDSYTTPFYLWSLDINQSKLIRCLYVYNTKLYCNVYFLIQHVWLNSLTIVFKTLDWLQGLNKCVAKEIKWRETLENTFSIASVQWDFTFSTKSKLRHVVRNNKVTFRGTFNLVKESRYEKND